MEILQHTNSSMSNQTVTWYQLDSEELYKKNLNERYSDLEKFNWVDYPIFYQFNSHGFRSSEFDKSTPNMVTLGCSHTFGIGLPVESVWNSVVADSLKLKNYNLGIGGGSNDTAFRMAYHYIPRLKPQVVVFLSTERTRFELATANNRFENLGVWDNFSTVEQFPKYWITNDINTNMNYFKNQLAIKQLCNEHNIKYVHLEASMIPLLDLARDLQHYGVKTHKGIANKVLKSL